MAEVEFTWALDGYCARYGFLAQPEGLTMREAARSCLKIAIFPKSRAEENT